MRSLGTKLREERERQGRSLEEISTRTKIRQSYLEAIEKDSLDSMPGGFFSRSFVRQYANALGMDGNDVENSLVAVTVDPADTVRVDKIFADYRPSTSSRSRPSVVQTEDDFESDFRHEAEFLKDSRSGASWVVFAILLIAGSGAYLAWQQKPDLFANVFAKTIAPAPTPAAAPAAPPVTVPATTAATPTTVDQPVAAPAVEAATVPSSPVEVAIVATEQAWVRLTVDREQIFGGVMEAGEKRTLRGQESAVVFTGNAGGLEFAHNGKSIGTVGTKGQVRTVVFGTQNWEIKSQQPKKIEETTPSPAPPAVREP